MRRVLQRGAVLFFTLALAACGGGGSSDDPTAGEPNATPPPTSPAPTTPSTPAPAPPAPAPSPPAPTPSPPGNPAPQGPTPLVRTIAPYVAYVDEPSPVTLFGEHLLQADGKSLFIGDREALDIQASSDTHATVDLPPLPAGEYTVRIGAPDGPEMARVVVRRPPVYRDATIDVSVSFEYDAERDALYTPSLESGEVQRLRNDGTGAWSVDTLPISRPMSLALSPDGQELFVVSFDCVVYRVDPDTLAVLESKAKACSDRSTFTAIAPLADGRVLVHQSNNVQIEIDRQPADVLEFPGLGETDVFPGKERPAFFLLNELRDRLLYVAPFIPGIPMDYVDGHADLYEISGGFRRVPFETGPEEYLEEFTASNLSMSAGGSRTLHSTNLDDREFNKIGRLTAEFRWNLPASVLNARGTQAAVVDDGKDGIYVYDLSGPGPDFRQIAAGLTLPTPASRPDVFLPPSGGAVFVATNRQLYVRASPALTR